MSRYNLKIYMKKEIVKVHENISKKKANIII